jgi:hypothetical protein
MSADNKTAATTATAEASDAPDASDKFDTPDQPDQLAKPQPGEPADRQARLIAATAAKHATLRYATLRIVIFIMSLGVLWGAVAATGHVVTGNGALYLMMGALLLSGVASFFLLSRQRDAMSARVAARTEKLTEKFQANAALEDED